MEECAPFRLFDLPPELRLRIYEYALAPSGVLCLTSTKTKRFAVEPLPTTQLLATCRKIHSEADGILFSDNEICITVDAHDTCWPTISEKRLPQRILEKLQHMCVILDCTSNFRADYDDVDLAAFKALTALKTMRIAVIYRKYDDFQPVGPWPERSHNIGAQLLERIPASTVVSYGTTPNSQQDGMLVKAVSTRMRAQRDECTIEQASAAVLEAAATDVVDLVRGCLSGQTADVFAESRATIAAFR